MTKGKPLKNGTGKGTGANAGRGGCSTPRASRRGRGK